jgi:hypothetical protein
LWCKYRVIGSQFLLKLSAIESQIEFIYACQFGISGSRAGGCQRSPITQDEEEQDYASEQQTYWHKPGQQGEALPGW